MQVIRHHHISAHGDITGIGVPSEGNERGIHRICSEQFSSLIRTECDKEDRVRREDPTKTWWKFWIFTHQQACSRFPVGSTMLDIASDSRRPQGDGYKSRAIVLWRLARVELGAFGFGV